MKKPKIQPTLKEEKKHARVSPSGIKNLVICPSMIGEPRDPNVPNAADEGTMMHEAFETGFLMNLNPEQASAVQSVIDYCKPFIDIAKREHVHREITLEILDGATFGTADLLVWHPNTQDLHVFDAKFGRNPVEDAETNKQGWCYAEGAWRKYPLAEHVTVHFIQPRCDEFSTHTFTPKDRQKIQTFIKMAIAKVNVPENERERNFDPHVCFYCGNLGTCPAPRQFGYGIAKQYEPDKVGNVKFDFPRDPATIMDGKQAGRAMVIADIMKKWSYAVADQVKQLAMGGTEIDGFALSERRGSTSLRTGAIGTILEKILTKKEFKKLKASPELFLEHADIKLDTVLDVAVAKIEDSDERTKTKAALLNELEKNGLVEHGQESYYLRKKR